MLTDIIGHIVNGLAMFGVAVVAFLIGKLVRKKSPQTGSNGSIADEMRVRVDQDAKRRQTDIESALNDDEPAQRLAELGNERRKNE